MTTGSAPFLTDFASHLALPAISPHQWHMHVEVILQEPLGLIRTTVVNHQNRGRHFDQPFLFFCVGRPALIGSAETLMSFPRRCLSKNCRQRFGTSCVPKSPCPPPVTGTRSTSTPAFASPSRRISDCRKGMAGSLLP